MTLKQEVEKLFTAPETGIGRIGRIGRIVAGSSTPQRALQSSGDQQRRLKLQQCSIFDRSLGRPYTRIDRAEARSTIRIGTLVLRGRRKIV
jgi:hypothetical protein